MKAFKSYFKAHLKASIRTLLYVLIITTVLTLVLGLSNQVSERTRWDVDGATTYTVYRSTIGTPVAFMCILAYVMPVMEFAFFKKRINLDCAYSMPISRRNMGLVHYLTGAITVLGAFTLSYLINFMLMLTHGSGHYVYAPMIGFYLVTAILGLAMYSFLVFVFNQANTKGDGIWFMILWTFAPILLFSALYIPADAPMPDPICSLPWGSFLALTASYTPLIEMDNTSTITFWNQPEYTLWFTFWLIIGVAAAVGLYFTFGKRRMEKTEEISNSFFGYRVMIPLYAITGNMVFGGLIFWIIIEIMALVGYTIYRRGFRYKLPDIIVLASMLLMLLLI